MKAKTKLFTVIREQGIETLVIGNGVSTRLIRAQTQKQVQKFLEAEALDKLHSEAKVEAATVDQVHELAVAGVKIEDMPETA